VLAAGDHGDATFLLSGYWTQLEPTENRRYMNAKVLSPSRLTGLSPAAAPTAAVAAERRGVCPAVAPRRGGVAFRFHRMLEVGGKVTGIGGRPNGLDRLDEGGWGSSYVRDNSVQAGGNEPGP
jgi:hypothetical protein